MRAIVLSLILLVPATSVLAGEEFASTGFESLARRAQKVFVGRVVGVEKPHEQHIAQILTMEVLEGWKNAAPGERVRVLAFEGVAHGGDPGDGEPGALQLVYLSPAPAKPAFQKFGANLYLPAGGEASIVVLEEADAEKILAAARSQLGAALDASALLQQLQSDSIRVRESALASLLARSQAALRPHATQLAARLTEETRGDLQAGLLTALAKSGATESIDPLISFCLENPRAEELLPLAAMSLNEIDAAETVRRLELRTLSTAPVQTRALQLLSHLDNPEAIRVLLEKSRAQRSASSGKANALSLEPAIEDLPGLLQAGSLGEKKAAAYRLYRWGNAEEKRLVQQEAKRVTDRGLRRFLEKLLREPYRSLAELSR